jgi:hypothetical protein
VDSRYKSGVLPIDGLSVDPLIRRRRIRVSRLAIYAANPGVPGGGGPPGGGYFFGGGSFLYMNKRVNLYPQKWLKKQSFLAQKMTYF